METAAKPLEKRAIQILADIAILSFCSPNIIPAASPSKLSAIVLKNKNRAFATLYKVQANTLCKMLFNFYV